ncbi:MAG: MipA/OmpV family protein [Pseudomonadota bacterium]
MKTLKMLALVGILASASTAFADSSDLENANTTETGTTLQTHDSVGLGFAYNQNIYDGVGNHIQAFPLLNLNYDDFFIQGFTAGYNAYQDESTTFALIVQPMFGGYDSSDSDALAGMSDTSYLVNTGVQMQYRLMPFSLTAAAVHDVTGRTGGNSASLKFAAMVPLDDTRMVLIPSITMTWLDSDITDYYYGVTQSEATATRAAYDPGTAVNIGYGLTLKYQMAEHWGATFGYVFTQYADDISDSPIVSRSYSSAVVAGISYIF